MNTTTKASLSPSAQAITLFASHAQSFTKSDIKLANFIAANYHRFLHMTISDLTEATALSEITISRFCKKLDIAGIQALKINLVYFMPNSQAKSDQDSYFPKASVNAIQEQDSMESICSKLFLDLKTGFNQTLELIDFAAVERAAQLIHQSKRLMFFGYGNSSVVCHDMSTRFVRFGFSCEASSDLHQQITLAAACDPTTLVVAVSFSGSSLHLDEVLKIAKSHGAKVVLLTSHNKSPATKYADAVLLGVCPEISNNTEASLSRIIYMGIADAIYAKLTLLRPDYKQHLEDIRRSLAILKS